MLSLFDLAGGVVVSHYKHDRIYLPTTIKLKLTTIQEEIKILTKVSKKLGKVMTSCKSTMLDVIGWLTDSLVPDNYQDRYCIIYHLRSVICCFLGELYFASNNTRYLKSKRKMIIVVKLIQHAIWLLRISAPTSDVYTVEMFYLSVMMDRWTLLSLAENTPNIFVRIVKMVEEPVDKSSVQKMIKACQLNWGNEKPNNRCFMQEMIRVCELRWSRYICIRVYSSRPLLCEMNEFHI